MPLQNSADGFVNMSYAGGLIEDIVLNRNTGNWILPFYGSGVTPDTLRWSLHEIDTWDKTSTQAPMEAHPTDIFEDAALDDITHWIDTGPDPFVVYWINKEDVIYPYRTSATPITYESLSAWWVDATVYGFVGAWGILDAPIIVNQYDTPIILAEDAKIGITSIGG
jgi:hypothetical protein